MEEAREMDSAFESVMDFPREEGLCPEVWEQSIGLEGEEWVLSEEAEWKIGSLVEFVQERLPWRMGAVHVTGSITSNSWTPNSDIDVHFLNGALGEESSEEVNESLRGLFEAYKASSPEMCQVGSHPLEVYFQANQFQDYMSVGCYDFTRKEWLVGPDFADQSFNPYSEYYKGVQEKSESLLKQVRDLVLSVYEAAVVMKKSAGSSFSESARQQLLSRLGASKNVYDAARKMRKAYSSPSSMEQALEWRNSRKWKIADASFKLLDKYGYMAMMKQFVEDYNALSSSSAAGVEVADGILNTVKNYINNADKMAEGELNESSQLDEGLAANLAIASLLAIAGILPVDALAKELKTVPKDKMHMTTEQVQKAIDKATADNTMVGSFSKRNAINILQWVYYTEGANQSLEGRKAIMSVIWNRAGGKPENLVPVVLKNGKTKSGKTVWQFAEWKEGNNWGLKAPASNKDWKYRVPADIVNPKVKKIWKEGEVFAKQMLDGKWKSTIGSRNLIANDNDSTIAKNTWGKACDLKIGDHAFGYDKSQDGFRKTAKTYTIAKGDTGYGIAKKLSKTFDTLKQLNPSVNWNKLKIGQKIAV